ncbi:MAG: MerR family transcriptional regulator [Candidatus Taylorbacteria bacterium]|nr:MerR family transcriptional regulator [Candidatus Taylorbacteria bacterium]
MSTFLTIKQASIMLGMTTLTLRNWDKRGKLKAVRHPMSNYRMYKLEDIRKILNDLETGATAPRVTHSKKTIGRRLVIKHIKD